MDSSVHIGRWSDDDSSSWDAWHPTTLSVRLDDVNVRSSVLWLPLAFHVIMPPGVMRSIPRCVIVPRRSSASLWWLRIAWPPHLGWWRLKSPVRMCWPGWEMISGIHSSVLSSVLLCESGGGLYRLWIQTLPCSVWRLTDVMSPLAPTSVASLCYWAVSSVLLMYMYVLPLLCSRNTV